MDKLQQSLFVNVYYRSRKPSVPLIQYPRLPKQANSPYLFDKFYSTKISCYKSTYTKHTTISSPNTCFYTCTISKGSFLCVINEQCTDFRPNVEVTKLHSVVITFVVTTLWPSANKEISDNWLPTFKQHNCVICIFLFAMCQ